MTYAQLKYYADRIPEDSWTELRAIRDERQIRASYTWRAEVIEKLAAIGICPYEVTPEIVRAIAKTIEE